MKLDSLQYGKQNRVYLNKNTQSEARSSKNKEQNIQNIQNKLKNDLTKKFSVHLQALAQKNYLLEDLFLMVNILYLTL